MTDDWVYIGNFHGEDPEVFHSFRNANGVLEDCYQKAEASNAEMFACMFKVRPYPKGSPYFNGLVQLSNETFERKEW